MKIKPFKVNTRFIKFLKRTVFFCGFPEGSVSQIHDICLSKGYIWEERNDKRIDVCGVDSHEENYDAWTEQILKRHEITNGTNDFKKYSPSTTPVVEKHYDLIVWFLPKLANFPKDQRFLLADRIEGMLLDILALLIKAVYFADRDDILKEVNLMLDQLRYLIRITKDMKYISIKTV